MHLSVKTKMEKLKTKVLLKMIDDIIINYSNTNDLIQRKLNEKCDGIGISIDKVICFFNKSRSKPSILYIL